MFIYFHSWGHIYKVIDQRIQDSRSQQGKAEDSHSGASGRLCRLAAGAGPQDVLGGMGL